jgi:hypothetical protein
MTLVALPVPDGLDGVGQAPRLRAAAAGPARRLFWHSRTTPIREDRHPERSATATGN